MHRALEADADVEAALRAADRRPRMVARFLTLHRAIDEALAPWGSAVASCGYAIEPRSGQIARDAAVLGVTSPPAMRPPLIGSLGEALGWLYVAEGSMLGGRIMRKAMRRDGIGLVGLGFLDPHGARTGERWQAFLAALAGAGANAAVSEAEVVRGGRDAFSFARHLLADDAVVEFAA